MTRQTLAQLACGLALIGALTACGGGGRSAAPGGTASSQPASTPAATSAPKPASAPATPANASVANSGPPVSKMLLVEVDGVTYNALAAGIAGGQLPNFAKLNVAPAYSGGVNGTLGVQLNLDTPGWATVLTGTWADRHQVNFDAPNQTLHASTVFQMLKSAGAGTLGAAVDSSGLAALLVPDLKSGNIDNLVNCASMDSCVTQNGVNMIDNGYSLVVAQYHSAQDAALNAGLSSASYANALTQMDAALGTLVTETGKRSNENWLVVVTTSHGLNAAGGTDGLPLPLESTSFIGLNQQPNALLGNSTAPTTMAALYTRASIADVTPTLLAYKGALPAPASYALDGGQLVGPTPVSQLVGTTGSNNTSLVLTWAAPASGAISVLRNGQTLTTLPAGTNTYTDSQLGLTTSGVFPFNYAVVAGNAPLATLTQVDYVAPAQPFPTTLAPTLATGLSSYYPFGALPPVDAFFASTMGPWAADADGGSLTTDPFGGKGLQVDTSIEDANGFDGYKLVQTNDVTKGAQFTIGFWFLTSCTNLVSSGTPVFVSESGVQGYGAGIAISLSAGSSTSCNLDFNLSDGTTFLDVKSLAVSANKWAYLALSVDTVANTFNAYVLDPVLGEQKVLGQSLVLNAAKLSGLGVFGLNEDGSGQFYANQCFWDSPPYTASECWPSDVQSFSDIALWTRVVTEAELRSIFGSVQPLSTLIP